MSLISRLRAFQADTSGATALIAGIMMPVMVMAMGLGAESGFHYMTQRSLQHAADLASHAGGVRLRAGANGADIMAAALNIATASGFRPLTDTITVHAPPTAGPDAGLATSVEVILTRTQPRFLSAIIDNAPLLIAARAVSRIVAPGTAACVLALSPTTSAAITVDGSTQVSLLGCDMASNSNADDAFKMVSNGARLGVDCIYTVGKANIDTRYLTLAKCAAPRELAPVVRDPYAGVAEPGVEGVCLSSPSKSLPVFTPNFVHSSGVPALRICGGLDIKKLVTFLPGLYIIDGGTFSLNANGSVLSVDAGIIAAGVTFMLTGTAKLSMTGNGGLNIQAPTTGPFAGILFFGSRSQTGITHEVLGNSGSVTQGAIYLPTSEITFSGNSSTVNGCTQIIASRVKFTGNSTLRSSCTTPIANGILTHELVKIVE